MRGARIAASWLRSDCEWKGPVDYRETGIKDAIRPCSRIRTVVHVPIPLRS